MSKFTVHLDLTTDLSRFVAKKQHYLVDFNHIQRQSVAQIQRLLCLVCVNCCMDAAAYYRLRGIIQREGSAFIFNYKD